MTEPIKYHNGGFPPKKIEWEAIISLIGPANAAIARYDGMLAAIPNPEVLIAPLTTREAVLSSQIEGTQATTGEVYEFVADEKLSRYSAEKIGDIREILNYRRALHQAVQQLSELPLSQRVIKNCHKTLMDGVRGANKAPGEYRRVSNWIGRPGCTIDDAEYVPISADKLPDAMSHWEKYIHVDAPDKLVQLAVLHAEFEALHPFLDGNGRLGRMLVPLFLYSNKALQHPMFYISSYLESNREEYYERLRSVSRDGDWTGWCKFFLTAIIIQAQENLEKTRAILDLYDRKKVVIAEATHSQYAIRTLDYLFSNPVFSSSRFFDHSQIPLGSATRILTILRERGIVTVLQDSRGNNPAIFTFGKMIDIIDA